MLKKIVLAAVAASVVASPVLAAPYDGHDNRGRYEQNHRGDYRNDRHDDRRGDYRNDRHGPQKVQYRNFRKGDRFDYRYARNYRVVNNYDRYHLRTPPRGYRWVQNGNDAVMIGITSGIVAAVLANVLN